MNINCHSTFEYEMSQCLLIRQRGGSGWVGEALCPLDGMILVKIGWDGDSAAVFFLTDVVKMQ